MQQGKIIVGKKRSCQTDVRELVRPKHFIARVRRGRGAPSPVADGEMAQSDPSLAISQPGGRVGGAAGRPGHRRRRPRSGPRSGRARRRSWPTRDRNTLLPRRGRSDAATAAARSGRKHFTSSCRSKATVLSPATPCTASAWRGPRTASRSPAKSSKSHPSRASRRLRAWLFSTSRRDRRRRSWASPAGTPASWRPRALSSTLTRGKCSPARRRRPPSMASSRSPARSTPPT